MRATCLFLALTIGLANVAWAAKPAPSPAKGQTIKTLDGKFMFTLPAGYATHSLPPADPNSKAAGAKGMMYMNEAERRVVVTTELPIPKGAHAGDNDDEFLTGATAGFIEQQASALPDFKKTSEKRITLRKLGIEQIDSTATMGGGATMTTTFVAGSGQTMSVIQVISRASDPSGHAAMIKRIVAGK